MTIQIWIVEWIYDDDGVTKIKTGKIKAESYESAKHHAAQTAPARDFVLKLHLQSDDQFLGQVTHRARQMAGQVDEVTDDDDP